MTYSSSLSHGSFSFALNSTNMVNITDNLQALASEHEKINEKKSIYGDVASWLCSTTKPIETFGCEYLVPGTRSSAGDVAPIIFDHSSALLPSFVEVLVLRVHLHGHRANCVDEVD